MGLNVQIQVVWDIMLFIPDVAKDHGVFFFRGQEVPEDMNAQCHVPKDVNSNSRFYKNMGWTLPLQLLRIAESCLKSYHYFSWSRSSWHFTKPGCSLPCSQDPTAGPYPEPCEPNLSIPSHFFETHYNTIFSSMVRSSKVLSFFQVFQQKPYVHFCSLPHMPHAPRILSSLIWSTK